VSAAGTYIRQVTACTTYHPNGRRTTSKAPAVWTLAHRGYSGSGRLDIWVYPSKQAALLASACQGALHGGWNPDLRRRTLAIIFTGLSAAPSELA
jgi:hypothetical protein